MHHENQLESHVYEHLLISMGVDSLNMPGPAEHVVKAQERLNSMEELCETILCLRQYEVIPHDEDVFECGIQCLFFLCTNKL